MVVILSCRSVIGKIHTQLFSFRTADHHRAGLVEGMREGAFIRIVKLPRRCRESSKCAVYTRRWEQASQSLAHKYSSGGDGRIQIYIYPSSPTTVTVFMAVRHDMCVFHAPENFNR